MSRSVERPWLLVARREVLTKVTDKGFLIGTLVSLLLLIGFFGFQIWSEERTETYTVAAAPADRGMVELIAERAPDVDDSIEVDPVDVDDADAGRAAVADEEVDAYLERTDDGWTLVSKDETPGDLEQVATQVVRDAALQENASRAGTTVEELEAGSTLSTRLLDGDAEQQGFAQAMGLALSFLFYFAALGFGYTLSGSIVEEKASRIVEIITTKIPVRQLLIGKIAGNSLLAVAQTALIVAVGLVGVSFTDYSSLLPAVTSGVGWFAAFFLVGFLFIACWWAVAGALASRAEDLQTTATPLSFLMMAVFFGSFLFEGTALTVASYVPPFSCVLMPIRLLQGDAAVWEPVAAIAILVAAMGATVVFAERIYRRALLQTQGRVTLKQAWQAAD